MTKFVTVPVEAHCLNRILRGLSAEEWEWSSSSVEEMERLVDAAAGADGDEEGMPEEEPDEVVAEEELAEGVTMVEAGDDEEGEDMVENADLREDEDGAELMDEEESVCAGLMDDKAMDPIPLAETEGEARIVITDVDAGADVESTCITACPCPCGCAVDMSSRASMCGIGLGTASTASRKGRRASRAVVKLVGLYMVRDGDRLIVVSVEWIARLDQRGIGRG